MLRANSFAAVCIGCLKASLKQIKYLCNGNVPGQHSETFPLWSPHSQGQSFYQLSILRTFSNHQRHTGLP